MASPTPVDSTIRAVGNTPVVKLQRVVPSHCAEIYVKLEYFNPTGSYKDRMALAMIEEAETRGDLRPGMTVVEYTGGSTGSSLAFVCAAKGYPFHVVSSDAFAQEKLRTMEAFGAQLEILPSPDGLITKVLIQSLIERAQEIAASDNTYFTDQFNNRDAQVGYREIGRELLQQFTVPIDVFCGGVGTAGMAMGVASVLRPPTRIVVLEPASSPVITAGEPGKHHVEGIGVGFIPPMLDPENFDEARAIDEGEARVMALRLAREEGIFAGTSSALNVVAAIEIGCELGPGHTVVTVACDSGLKYLSGDLYDS